MSWVGPRTFEPGVTYTSHALSYDTGEREEILFTVLAPSDKYWNRWMGPAIEYWALDLCSGSVFEFHRDSVLAENATELLR